MLAVYKWRGARTFLQLHLIAAKRFSRKIELFSTMKLHALFLLVLVVAVAYVTARPEETYTDKYDNVDVDQILKSERLFSAYYKCLMDEGKCTPDAAEIRKVMPDALETDCSKCTKTQKETVKKVIKHLVNDKPDMWTRLADKYDPDRKYRTKHENEAKEIGVKL
ncbi:chemosensory protein 3 [Xylocopa sonorina]|uniref:chemosensory protein 3 n=1 Tax=Xylocopa sonorina TaxID=1818115 RepID=UPI00403AB3CB